jgi:hypothetical protein
MTTAWDPTQVRLGTTGDLWRAPVGTPAPVDTAALTTPWVNLGYASDDGVTAQPQITKTDIMVWQSAFPVRERIVQGVDFKFKLVQDNPESLQLAFGGGDYEALTGIYTPPAPGEVYENAFCFDVIDGTVNFRYFAARAIVTDVADIVMKADEAIGYELTVTVLASGSTAPWQRIDGAPITLAVDEGATSTARGGERSADAA